MNDQAARYELARLFHETYERLAPTFGYEPRAETSVPWDEVPEPNRSLMIAVAGEVLDALASPEGRRANSSEVRSGSPITDAPAVPLVGGQA